MDTSRPLASQTSSGEAVLTFAFQRKPDVTLTAAKDAITAVVGQIIPAVAIEFLPARSVGPRTGLVSITAPKSQLPDVVRQIKSLDEITSLERVSDTPLIRATLVI